MNFAVMEKLGTFLLQLIKPNAPSETAVTAVQVPVMAGATLAKPKKTPWAKWMDGLNRLPRPLAMLLTFLFLIVGVFEPSIFEKMAALPEGFWMLATVLVGFFFGGRMQTKSIEANQLQILSNPSVSSAVASHELPKLESEYLAALSQGMGHQHNPMLQKMLSRVAKDSSGD